MLVLMKSEHSKVPITKHTKTITGHCKTKVKQCRTDAQILDKGSVYGYGANKQLRQGV